MAKKSLLLEDKVQRNIKRGIALMAIKIEDIRELAKEKKIRWRNHMLERMKERNITREDILECIFKGEIIEQYEKDYPYPSCLIGGFSEKGEPLHLVCAVGEGFVWLITAYFPSEEEWMPDFKTRRKNK